LTRIITDSVLRVGLNRQSTRRVKTPSRLVVLFYSQFVTPELSTSDPADSATSDCKFGNFFLLSYLIVCAIERLVARYWFYKCFNETFDRKGGGEASELG